MNYLSDTFYKENMPARAKRLYQKTFNKHHKLNGGDEEIALHLARRAVEKDYVKLNDSWLPKAAVEIIVKHNMDNDSLSDDETNFKHNKFFPLNKSKKNSTLDTMTDTEESDEDEDNDGDEHYEHTIDTSEDDEEKQLPRNSVARRQQYNYKRLL
jgi:cation transport regulator ChaB